MQNELDWEMKNFHSTVQFASKLAIQLGNTPKSSSRAALVNDVKGYNKKPAS